MKFKQFIIILVTISIPVFSVEDCYTSLRQKAIEAYNRGEYDRAKNTFQAAKEDCDDAPVNNDIDLWIQKCNSAKKKTSNSRANASKASGEYSRRGSSCTGLTTRRLLL